MTILSGSFVEYGPRTEGGGDVLAVDCEGAHEGASDAKEDMEFLRGLLGWSYGRYEWLSVSSVPTKVVAVGAGGRFEGDCGLGVVEALEGGGLEAVEALDGGGLGIVEALEGGGDGLPFGQRLTLSPTPDRAYALVLRSVSVWAASLGFCLCFQLLFCQPLLLPRFSLCLFLCLPLSPLSRLPCFPLSSLLIFLVSSFAFESLPPFPDLFFSRLSFPSLLFSELSQSSCRLLPPLLLCLLGLFLFCPFSCFFAGLFPRVLRVGFGPRRGLWWRPLP